tara:strand:+ start:100953 stop:101108 length:156 start_codon:yes stop_codon:yes gene_type:complete
MSIAHILVFGAKQLKHQMKNNKKSYFPSTETICHYFIVETFIFLFEVRILC